MIQKLFLIWIVSGMCFSASFGQAYTCDEGSFEPPNEPMTFIVSNILCDTKGTSDTDDDMIQFTVTGENGSSVESIIGFNEEPTIISSQPFDNTSYDESEGELDFFFGSNSYNVVISANSPNCIPLNLSVELGICPQENLMLAPEGFVAAIPTLTQWGTIIFGLILLTFGISALKSRVSEQELT